MCTFAFFTQSDSFAGKTLRLFITDGLALVALCSCVGRFRDTPMCNNKWDEMKPKMCYDYEIGKKCTDPTDYFVRSFFLLSNDQLFPHFSHV